MTLKQDVEFDIKQMLKQLKNQTPEDQVKTVKNLISKYCHITTAVHLMDMSDFRMIKGFAQNFFLESSLPKKIEAKYNNELSINDNKTLSIIEGTILHLNGSECFKKLPKFKYIK